MAQVEDDKERAKPVRARKAQTRAAVPVVLEGSRVKRGFLKQGTTWAGILTIAAAVATGGTSVLLDPMLLSQVGAGIALLIAEN